MKASRWESLSCRTMAFSLFLDLIPIWFHQWQQLFYWWALSARCLRETRTAWDWGKTDCSPVAEATVPPTRENISMENISMENMGMWHLLSGKHLSVNSPPPCELPAKEEVKERKFPHQQAQICEVSWPYLHSVSPSSSLEFWFLQHQPHWPVVSAVTVSVVLWREARCLGISEVRKRKLVWICE